MVVIPQRGKDEHSNRPIISFEEDQITKKYKFLQGNMFLYRFLFRFSGLWPSLRENKCLHSCCCRDSNSSQNPALPEHWLFSFCKIKLRHLERKKVRHFKYERLQSPNRAKPKEIITLPHL